MTNPQRTQGIGDLSFVVCHFSFVILGDAYDDPMRLTIPAPFATLGVSCTKAGGNYERQYS
jgi:hypothetical protein